MPSGLLVLFHDLFLVKNVLFSFRYLSHSFDFLLNTIVVFPSQFVYYACLDFFSQCIAVPSDTVDLALAPTASANNPLRY